MSKTASIAGIVVVTTLWLTLLCSPAFAQGYSVGLAGHDYTAALGDTLNGTIKITSTSDKSIGITVTRADLMRSPEAKASYELITETGKEPRSLQSWLTYSPDTIDLPTKGQINVNYHLQIPNDPSLHGTYWGTLVVAALPSQEELSAPPEPAPDKPTVGIKFAYRYIVLITVTIQGAEQPQDKFTNISIEEGDAGPLVVAEFQNLSTTFSRPQYWLQLKDTAGQTAYASEKLSVTLLPESKRLVKVGFTDKPLAAGEYLLLIVADYGAPKLIGAQAKLTVSTEQAAKMAEDFRIREEAKLAATTATAAPNNENN